MISLHSQTPVKWQFKTELRDGMLQIGGAQQNYSLVEHISVNHRAPDIEKDILAVGVREDLSDALPAMENSVTFKEMIRARIPADLQFGANAQSTALFLRLTDGCDDAF